MCKKLFVLMLLVAFTASTASALIITGVDRTRGTAGDRPMIGLFDQDTDPLPPGPGTVPGMGGVGLIADTYLAFSDREYGWMNVHPAFAATPWESIPTFNTDKDDDNFITNYAVTIESAARLWICVDDRWDQWKSSGGVVELASQQEGVDIITHQFAAPGAFYDTTYNLTINERSYPGLQEGKSDKPRAMSLYISTATYDPGTYTFGAFPIDKNFYIMGAVVPEPATIALLGFGALALIRKKR